MNDLSKTHQELIEENTLLRQRIHDLEYLEDKRKQMEETLRASEIKYRQLHQSMMDAFASVDMDGHIKEYNESYLGMLGYSPEEIRNLTYKDITPEKWHLKEDDIINEQVLTRGYSDIYEKEYRKKDGIIFPVN